MIKVSRAIIVMQLNNIKLSLLIHKASLTNGLLRKVFAIIPCGVKSRSHIAFSRYLFTSYIMIFL